MDNKLKIAVLSPYLPALDTTACARKVFDYIRLLQQRGQKILLLCFCSSKDKKRIESIKPFCTEIDVEYISDYYRYPCRSKKLTNTIQSLCKARQTHVLQCENSFMACYLPSQITVPLVLTEHEILSASFYQRAALEQNPVLKTILHLRAAKKMIEQKYWYNRFNAIIVFTAKDKESLSKHYGLDNIVVIPLGINVDDYPVIQNSEPKIYDIMFVGNFSHWPNVDGVRHFCQQVLPLIKRRLPDVSVILVGACPPQAIKRLAQAYKNITVTDYIGNIRETYLRSRVFVAPIRYGTGMRFKILEAWALRMPVVSTAVGACGIVMNGNIRIADTPPEFARAVIALLKNQKECERLGASGRLTVERYYNWNTLVDKYEKTYYSLFK